jgi:hypothetical protein
MLNRAMHPHRMTWPFLLLTSTSATWPSSILKNGRNSPPAWKLHFQAAMRGERPAYTHTKNGATTQTWFKHPSITYIRRDLVRRGPEHRSTRKATRHAAGTRKRATTSSSSSGDDGPLPHRAADRAARRSTTAKAVGR